MTADYLLRIGRKRITLKTNYNSKAPYPLSFFDDRHGTGPVFNDDGTWSAEFVEYMGLLTQRYEADRAMSEPKLLPGIREASETFWQHMQSLSPPVVLPDTYNHSHVSTALLLALARFREAVAPGTMETDRKRAADQAYELYDHGDVPAVFESPWQVFNHLWLRIVVLESSKPTEPDVLVFGVWFETDPESTEVRDAYYIVKF